MALIRCGGGSNFEEVTGLTATLSAGNKQAVFASGKTGYSKVAMTGCTGYIPTNWGSSASYLREFTLTINPTTGDITMEISGAQSSFSSGPSGCNFVLYN